MNTTIYIDEAGNTGQDMLNVDQKVFVLASVNFNEDQLSILKSIFKTDNEIHFKKMKDTERGRKLILEFINHGLITENNIIVSTCHKEYAVVANIVDKLIETVFYYRNIDIYKYGLNISLTNYIYIFGNSLWDKRLFSEMLTEFINMIRTKSDNAISNFYSKVKMLKRTIDLEYYLLLDFILESRKYIVEILEAIDKFSIDVTLSSFLVLSDKWYRMTNKKLDIFYDNSKQIKHYQEYIDFMRKSNSELKEIGFGSRKMFFPAQINSLKLVDSSTSISIQFADLIASTIGFMYNNLNSKHDKFIHEIQESKLINLTNYHTIWPSTKVNPNELDMLSGDGINVLDFLASKMEEYDKEL